MTLQRKCALCGQPRKPDFTPFCSKQCKDRDLLKWLGDGYALPGRPQIDEDEV